MHPTLACLCRLNVRSLFWVWLTLSTLRLITLVAPSLSSSPSVSVVLQLQHTLLAVVLPPVLSPEVCKLFLMFLSQLVDNGDLQTTSVASLLPSVVPLLLAMACSNNTLTAAHLLPCTLKHLFTTLLHRPDSRTSAQALTLRLLMPLLTLLSPLLLQLPHTQVPLSSPCKAWYPASL